MDLVKTGLGLGKTIRNVSRLREIVMVFAKHGFHEFITTNITALIPDLVLPESTKNIRREMNEEGGRTWGKILGRRLCQCFEELGPSFIKFGQLLSSREDLFDALFVNEMKTLRDKVAPMSFSELKPYVEASLGRKCEEVFASIDEHPIGNASIGVVFKGKLKNGETVVLKVRRPHIKKIVETDFSILRYLAIQVEKVSEELRYLGITRLVDGIANSLNNELNFNIEALNCERFDKIVKKYDEHDFIAIPKIYKEYSGEDLLVMEYFDGVAFTSPAQLKEKCSDLEDKLLKDFDIFLKAFLQDGFFHADLHAGNIFLLENDRIGLIDFGLMGTLSKKSRVNFVAIIYAILNFNYENLVYEFLDVADYEQAPDVDLLIHDVRDALSPYVGLTAQQTDFSEVLRLTMVTLRNHQIYLPKDWYTIFRSFIALDGLARSIDFDIDLYSILEKDIQAIMQTSFTKDDLIEEGFWLARDFSSFSRALPRHLKWYLKDWSKRKYAHRVELTGYENSFNNLYKGILFLSLSLVSSIMIVCGTLLLPENFDITTNSIPQVVLIFWALGLLSFLFGIRKLR